MKGIFSALALFLSILAFGQQPTFSVKIDTNFILIGQQTYLRFTASNINLKQSVAWPTWPDTLQNVEILRVDADTVIKDNMATIHANYLLTSWDSGFAVIPPLAFVAGGDSLFTEPQILQIGTVPADAAVEIYDIKAPLTPPIDWWYWAKRLWFVALILALLLGGWIWWLLRKKREKRAGAVAPDNRTPTQRALDKLHAINAQTLWQNGKTKAYYSAVADTLRQFVEDAENITALEMPTDDVLLALRGKIGPAQMQTLAQILTRADLVKFAKAIPTEAQNEEVLALAFDFIKQQDPKPTGHVDA